MNIYMKAQSLRWPLICAGIFIPIVVFAQEFYEKSDVITRLEKREVVSVVKLEPHPKSKQTIKILDMTAVGLVDGVTLDRSVELMADYPNLHKIAPDYIKLSELIVKKKDGKYLKYLHMKNEVKTILGTYKVEIYTKVHEEKLSDRGYVHWEIIEGSTLGRKNAPGDFVGMKGYVMVQKYARPSGMNISDGRSMGFYRSRPKKDQLTMMFHGRLERDESGMSKIIPNFILQFAMEVALQRVGILLRNYLETAKEIPPPLDLEKLAQEEEKRRPTSPSKN